MSPSWRESLRIALCPDGVAFARYSRGLRSKLLDKGTLPVDAGLAEEPWRPALAAMSKVLQAQTPRAADATVVLSNHFVRYVLLKADARVSSRSEWLEYASHRFEKTYGARARAWDVQFAETGADHPRLASAIDKALLDAIAAAFRGSRARLKSVQPYLMVAFNQALPSIKHSSFWLVVHEPGRLLLGLVRDGFWRSVRGRQADANWLEALPQTLQREGALIAPEESSREVVVCAAGEDRLYQMVRA